MLVTDRLRPLRVDGRVVHQIWLPYHWGSAGLVTGDSANDLFGITLDPNVLIQESKVGTCDIRPGRRPTGPALLEYVAEYRRRAGLAAADAPLTEPEPVGRTACTARSTRRPTPATSTRRRGWASSPTPASASAARRARWPARSGTRVPDDGFNLLGMSYDNTGGLTANSWRHVAFIEQPADPSAGRPDGRDDLRWLMMSDVCKHCTHAACLDVCPTGSLFRTEFGTVVVQEDICNGCGYCIPACPYGVIDQRKDDGRAWKCTLCYDRIGDGLTPGLRDRPARPSPSSTASWTSCASGPRQRVDALHAAGVAEARLYGHDPDDGVGGDGAFFLLLDEPEVYGLPPDPVVTTRDLPAMWKRAGCRGAGAWSAVRRSSRSLGGDRERAATAWCRRRVPVVLRPADRQGAGVEARHPGVPVHRRARRRVRAARRRRRPDRPAGAAPRRAG